MNQYTEEQMTPFFDGVTNPARPGVYQRLQAGQVRYWRWNGSFWEQGGYISATSVPEKDDYSLAQRYPWRGLAFDPSQEPR